MTPDELRALVDDLAGRPLRWSGRVRHDPEARVYERLWRDDEVEVWLICWAGEDHDTGMHDHGDSAGALAVVSGELVEERLLADGRTLRRHLRPGARLAFPHDHVHRVRGVDAGPAVSIHAYSPPLRRLGVYRRDADGAYVRESVPAEHELRPVAHAPGDDHHTPEVSH